jgi:hypothetical protein
MSQITSIEQLRQLYTAPTERVVKKDIGHIDVHCRRFIELSPFVTLSTHNSENQSDCSPRGGQPGFVKVIDSKTLVIPDWSGNNRLDTLTNILDIDSIGLMFLIPGVDEVLRVNGTAELNTDMEYRELCMEQDKLPKLVIVVRVNEAYLHCAKALMRSELWSEKAKVDRKALPSAGQILKDHVNSEGEPETTEAMYQRYKRELY